MAARNGSGFWKKVKWIFLRAVMVVVLVLFGLEFVNLQQREAKPVEGGGRAAQRAPFVTLENLPEYTGRSFVVLYGNRSFPKNSRQRKIRIIRLRPWMHWGAAGRRTESWGRSSFPRSRGDPLG